MSSVRTTTFCRSSIRQLYSTSFRQSTAPASALRRSALVSSFKSASYRLFSTTTSKMAPPAPAGLFSNRYKLEDIPDLSGKVVIVSGGSRGIGEALVTALAKKGAEVHILSTRDDHGQEAIDKITSEVPSAQGKLKHHQVDLGSISELKDLLPTLKNLHRIDILYLIAGIGVAPFGLTKDGLPNHFQVNNLSQLLLVDGLMPKLIETSKSKQGGSEYEKYSTRIVAESSELHRASPSDVKFESVQELSKDIDETKLYGRSKLMNILFIRELAKKHLPALNSESPILALSTHPGAVSTEQQQGATEAYGVLGKALEKAASVLFMAPEQGAESASWAGTGETVASRREEVQGRYFSEADGKVDTESKQAQDDQLAKALWDLGVKTLKEKGNYDVTI